MCTDQVILTILLLSTGLTPLLSTLTDMTTQTGGCVLYDGELRQVPFKRTVGFTPKSDFHLAHLTVYETLFFSARMRMPASLPDSLVHLRVKIIGMLKIVDVCSNFSNNMY